MKKIFLSLDACHNIDSAYLPRPKEKAKQSKKQLKELILT